MMHWQLLCLCHDFEEDKDSASPLPHRKLKPCLLQICASQGACICRKGTQMLGACACGAALLEASQLRLPSTCARTSLRQVIASNLSI